MKTALRKLLTFVFGTAVLSLAATGVFAYVNDPIFFGAFDRIDSALWPNQRLLGKARHLTGRFFDELNPLFSEANVFRSLDRYELTLSPADIKELYASAGPAPGAKPGGDNFRNIAVSYNGGPREEAGMKLHGDLSTHWSGRKKSFQLKFPKETYHRRNRKWLFIIPEDRGYLGPLFAAELAKRMGLAEIRNDLVAVKMNDVFQGTYYLEEHLNEKFLERVGFSGPVLVNLADHWIEDRPQDQRPEDYRGGITYNAQHHTPFDLEISNVEDFESELKPQVLARVNEFFDAIRRKDTGRFEALVDVEIAGAVDAWRIVMGDSHCLAGDNVKMAYALSNGKFYFLPRSEGHIQPLEYAGGGFEAEMSKKGRIVPLLEMLARSENIRRVRNRWLRRFTQEPREILAMYDRLAGRLLPVLKQDPTLPHNSREVAHEIANTRAAIARNLKALSDQFRHHNVYVNAVTHENAVDFMITPDTSLDALRLDSLRFELEGDPVSEKDRVTVLAFREGAPEPDRIGEFVPAAGELAGVFKEIEFGFDFDETMKPKARRYRFRMIFENRERLKIKAVRTKWSAAVGGVALDEGEIYVALADGTGDFSFLKFQTAEEFVGRYAQYPWKTEGNRLSLDPGSFEVTEDIVVPQGLVFELKAGTELRIAPDKSVVSYSPLKIRGENGNPVVIRASDPERPFGTFAVVGEKGFSCEIDYLDLSGGREAKIDGVFFIGAFCLYHTDAVVRNSRIHDNHADDGINIKFGKVLIENSRFDSNFADQVDLDFSTGTVRRCDFRAPQTRSGTDTNGDGLDLSGSRVLVTECSFRGFLDKALSVGEATKTAVIGNKFSDNVRGSAVKDQSAALFMNNVFERNEIAITSYQKKGIYGGGGVYLFQNTWDEKGEFLRLEGDSASYAPTPSGASFLASLEKAGDNVDFDRLFGERAYWNPDTHGAKH